MKRVLCSLVSACAALAFAGAVWAADYPATDTTQGGTSSDTTMQNNGTTKKKTKKAKKRKSKKTGRTEAGGSGMGTGGGTGPNYGTPNMGGPSGNEIGQPRNQPDQINSNQ